MNDGAANATTSIQDGAWSTVVLKPTIALTPNSPDWDDDNNPYLDEMPEDEDDPYLDEMPEGADAPRTLPGPTAHICHKHPWS